MCNVVYDVGVMPLVIVGEIRPCAHESGSVLVHPARIGLLFTRERPNSF